MPTLVPWSLAETAYQALDWICELLELFLLGLNCFIQHSHTNGVCPHPALPILLGCSRSEANALREERMSKTPGTKGRGREVE